MPFKVDKQTIKDIELYAEKRGQPSVFGFYNQTVTKGAGILLFEIFKAPTSDIEFLGNRKNEIKFFSENNCYLKLNSRSIDFIEYYLASRRVPLKANIIDATFNAISNKLNPNNDYYTITEGIINISLLLVDLHHFLKETKSYNISGSIKDHLDEIKEFLSLKPIKNLVEEPPKKAKDLNYNQINTLDNYFRQKKKESFRNLLVIVYEIDFLQTMAKLIHTKGLSLPEYRLSSNSQFEAVDSFHPFLPEPVKNSFEFTDHSNVCFLTGPNMSGKSTFLKTMGLLVYLSHLGLPVPAKKYTTSIFEGLITTINLSDNLNL
jgi:DNA mismatch repair ATPase MutS